MPSSLVMMKTYKVNTAAGREAAHNSSVSGGAQAITSAFSLPPSVNFYADGEKGGGGGGGGFNSAGISMAKKFGKVVRYKRCAM